MSPLWRRILIAGGFAIGVAIVVLLAVIASVLLSEDNGGPGSAVAGVTPTAAASPAATATPRPTPTRAPPTPTPQPTPQPTEEPPPAPVVQEQPPPTQEEPAPPTQEPPVPTEEPPPPTPEAPPSAEEPPAATASALGFFLRPVPFHMGQEGEFAATHVSVNVASLTFARTGGPVNGAAHYLASGPVCPGEESQVGLDVVLQGSLDLQAGSLQGTAQWDFISSSPDPAGPGGACQVHQDEWRLVASFNGFLDDDRVVLEIRPDQNAIPGGYYGETYAVVELAVQGP